MFKNLFRIFFQTLRGFHLIVEEIVFRKYTKFTFSVFVSWWKTFAKSTIRKLSVRFLCVLSIARWVNLFCDIFALSQVFIRRAVENDRSPVALVAGLTNRSLQVVITSLIIGLVLWSRFFTASKMSRKHSSFLSFIIILKISSCGTRNSNFISSW